MEQTLIAQGKAKLVWHNFAFLGPESLLAAEAASCANEQGKFWPYHDKLFSEQAGENRGVFSKDNLRRFASDLGLNAATFNACLDSGRYATAIKDETAAGQRLGVRATPTFFVNGRKIEGVPSFDQLRQLVEQVTPATPTSSGRAHQPALARWDFPPTGQPGVPRALAVRRVERRDDE